LAVVIGTDIPIGASPEHGSPRANFVAKFELNYANSKHFLTLPDGETATAGSSTVGHTVSRRTSWPPDVLV
jgi:hypothetical protein